MIYEIHFSPKKSAQIATRDGLVIETTWSMKWAVGKDISTVIDWMKSTPNVRWEIADTKCCLNQKVAA